MTQSSTPPPTPRHTIHDPIQHNPRNTRPNLITNRPSSYATTHHHTPNPSAPRHTSPNPLTHPTNDPVHHTTNSIRPPTKSRGHDNTISDNTDPTHNTQHDKTISRPPTKRTQQCMTQVPPAIKHDPTIHPDTPIQPTTQTTTIPP